MTVVGNEPVSSAHLKIEDLAHFLELDDSSPLLEGVPVCALPGWRNVARELLSKLVEQTMRTDRPLEHVALERIRLILGESKPQTAPAEVVVSSIQSPGDPTPPTIPSDKSESSKLGSTRSASNSTSSQGPSASLVTQLDILSASTDLRDAAMHMLESIRSDNTIILRTSAAQQIGLESVKGAAMKSKDIMRTKQIGIFQVLFMVAVSLLLSWFVLTLIVIT